MQLTIVIGLAFENRPARHMRCQNVEEHLGQLDQQMADLLAHHHDAVHRLAERVVGSRSAPEVFLNLRA